jgi:uncharacterized protein YggL (DUF469 family)
MGVYNGSIEVETSPDVWEEVVFEFSADYYHLPAKLDGKPEDCYPEEEEFESYLTIQQLSQIPGKHAEAVFAWLSSKDCEDFVKAELSDGGWEPDYDAQEDAGY